MQRVVVMVAVSLIGFALGILSVERPMFPDDINLEVDWDREMVIMPLEEYSRIVKGYGL